MILAPRIAPLASADIPAPIRNMPSRTDDGDPWVRWIHLSDHTGWMTLGTRKPLASTNMSFWEKVFVVCCEFGNERVDAVHAIGPGLLSVGGLGATVASGFAQALLHMCMVREPERFVEVMFPCLYVACTYTAPNAKAPHGVAFMEAAASADRAWHPEPLLRQDQLADLIALGSDSIKWSTLQKSRASMWVRHTGRLLRDARFDLVQQDFVARTLPTLLSLEALETIRWPHAGVRYGWGWSVEQQTLWAIAMVLGLYDSEQTNKLLLLSVYKEPYNARDTILRMVRAVSDRESYTESFRDRARDTILRMQELFGVGDP